jgi:hypothetical protein
VNRAEAVSAHSGFHPSRKPLGQRFAIILCVLKDSLVMHRPIDAFFVVYPRKRLPRDAFLKLEDFDALLMCVLDGAIGPWGFELERLRREAVVIGLSYLGFVWIIRVSDYAFGEECLVSDSAG